MSRKVVIAGNWKMNKTAAEGRKLIEELKPLVAGSCCAEVVVCPPFTTLAAVVEAARGSNIKVGAQNVHWEKSGAFTGEISAEMLKELGVEYVIIGHSERRQFFGETDATVNKRTKAAITADLKVLLCIGETLAEREENRTKAVLDTQITGAFEGICPVNAAKIVIAYEPVWAIGTGKTATPEMAEETHACIRAKMAEIYGNDVAEKIVIQYGGSMKADNAEALLAQKNIDGGLIGGAALKADSFAELIANAVKGAGCCK